MSYPERLREFCLIEDQRHNNKKNKNLKPLFHPSRIVNRAARYP